jgi:hypothetical protein
MNAFSSLCEKKKKRIYVDNPYFIVFLERISSGAQYVALQKYFSHPSLVIYFFATPPRKLKLGQQIGGGLLIANHMVQSS